MREEIREYAIRANAKKITWFAIVTHLPFDVMCAQWNTDGRKGDLTKEYVHAS